MSNTTQHNSTHRKFITFEEFNNQVENYKKIFNENEINEIITQTNTETGGNTMPPVSELVALNTKNKEITQITQEIEENIETEKSKKLPRFRRWCGTFHTELGSTDANLLLTLLKQHGTKYIIGKETGEKGETPHLQIYVEFKNGITLMTLKKKYNNTIHWTKCRGDRESNYIYCSKEGNFETNIEFIQPYEETPDVISELNPFQQSVINTIKNENPDNRSIYWYVDYIGNSGKSSLCKYLAINQLATIIQSGKASDVKNFLMTNKHTRDICFDLTRANENFVSYSVMEELKNGMIYSGKYEGGFKLISTPHIFVFANFYPDLSKFSQDRLIITELSKKEEKIETIESDYE